MTEPTCPKSMTYGPCGGVRASGGCEVDDRPCPFVQPGVVIPAVPPGATGSLSRLFAQHHPLILVDVRAPAQWHGDVAELWQRTAESLQGCVALLGEHADNPRRHDDAGPIDPAGAVSILTANGVPTIATVTGRDRDLDGARMMMERLVDAGASAIHCVTGDHPAALGIDRSARFGAESITLVQTASALGAAATVAESPASPGPRASRLRAKQDAGASACILNHAGSDSSLIAFAEDCTGVGLTIPLVAPLPMVGDKQAAMSLAQFPGLHLPDGYLATILDADDPMGRALDATSMIATRLARSGRFAGVNLSGSASGTDPWERLTSTRRFVAALRDAWSVAAA